jgi:hypothetical protein
MLLMLLIYTPVFKIGILWEVLQKCHLFHMLVQDLLQQQAIVKYTPVFKIVKFQLHI